MCARGGGVPPCDFAYELMPYVLLHACCQVNSAAADAPIEERRSRHVAIECR